MLNNIQVLRGYAVILVIFVHLGFLLEKVGLKSFGHTGVDLFFVISGFIMVHISKNRKADPLEFMKRRVIRIVPLYWFVTLGVSLIAFLAPKLMPSIAADIDLIAILKSLFFIPWMRTDVEAFPIVYVGWTLNLEMFFYLVFAISLLFKDLLRAVIFSNVVLLALIAVPFLTERDLGIFSFYTNPRIINFCFGMIIGLVAARFPSSLHPNVTKSLIVLGVACGVILVFTNLHFLVVATSSAALVVIALLLEKSGFVVRSKALLAIGDASYSIYLSHAFVAILAERFILPKVAGAGDLVVYATICFVITLCSIVGIGIYHFIERPVAKFKF
jgi:exopolysaccharide production protein ExoZ